MSSSLVKFTKYEEQVFETIMSINNYFRNNPGKTKVPVNVLMSYLLEKRIFTESQKKRTPVEELLDLMNEKDHINALPWALGEDGRDGVKWSFVFLKGRTLKELEEKIQDEQSSKFVELGDENYLIDLCDEILQQEAIRQYVFEIPYSGRNFPMEAYYPRLNLAVYYKKLPQSNVVTRFENINLVSDCSVHREREKDKFLIACRELLPHKNIQLFEMDHSNFSYNKAKHLLKNKTLDSLVLKQILNRTR